MFDAAYNEIKFGEEGGYKGIPMLSFPRINALLGGIQKARYDLVGGGTGTGKTAFIDQAYCLDPYDYIMNHETDMTFHVRYYSMEISKARKITKWLCHRLYRRYGAITDWKTLLSYGDKKLPPSLRDLVIREKQYFEKMSDYIDIIEGKANPTKIAVETKKYAELHGKSLWVHKRTKEERSERPGEEDIGMFDHIYRPDNPKKIVLIIADNINNLRREREHAEGNIILNKKQTIDRYSQQAIERRDFYGFSDIAVSQFNRDLADVQRKRFTELQPQLEDFKESGNTQEDADTVIALFNPKRYNIASYMGYNMANLTNRSHTIDENVLRFRSTSILKNRGEADMIRIGLRFIGENGHFCELPRVEDVAHDEERQYARIMDFNNKSL